MIVAAVALLSVAAVWWWTALREPAPQDAASKVPAAEAPRLLAVLPFENISGGSEGFFAQGMTQEVTSQLSKLSALRVVGSAAVAQFKDPRRQLAALAKELGIGSAVTGTVREQGTQVRVNVELIDAQSGRVIWSEQYDREGVDVFAAQSDIAVQVGKALNASVTLEEQARIGKRPTSSVAAYELFVRAQKPSGKTDEERLKASVDLLNRAVAIDPQFAAAYSELANIHYFLGAYGDRSALARGVEAGNTALKIDPELASGYRGLALNLNEMGRLREALPAYLKAVTLNPSYGSGLVDFAHGLATAGQYDESLAYARGRGGSIPTPGAEPITRVLRSCSLTTTRDRSAFSRQRRRALPTKTGCRSCWHFWTCAGDVLKRRSTESALRWRRGLAISRACSHARR